MIPDHEKTHKMSEPNIPGQGVHREEPEGAKVPLSQVAHTLIELAPIREELVPASHGVQLLDPEIDV